MKAGGQCNNGEQWQRFQGVGKEMFTEGVGCCFKCKSFLFTLYTRMGKAQLTISICI